MSFGHCASFYKTFFIVVNMALITFGVEKRHSYFYSVEETGKEEELGLLDKVPSLLTCARLCGTYSDPSKPHCVGIQFDEHDTLSCRLLSGNVNWTPFSSSVGIPIYRKGAPSQYTDGIQMFNVSDYEFRLSLFDTKVSYSDARSSCLKMGANLLHLDTDSKFQAALAVMGDSKATIAWIGINDMDLEGHWVYELTGQPLTPDAESRWGEGRPGNNFWNEDCGLLYRVFTPDRPLYDVPCYNHYAYICKFR